MQLYNLIVVAMPAGTKRLSIQYGTSPPPRPRTPLIREAEAVASQLYEFADRQSITRATAQICRTRSQAEARAAITEIISLEREPDGSWHANENADPTERRA